MIINQDKMREVFGGNELMDYTPNDAIRFIKERMEYLVAHNKNYNSWQWVYIQDIKDVLDAIEVL